ncbi:preprotein translocase subunit SecE [Rhodococcus spongiicola]|uniref:Protein translocase subunit SecE n=1 Tax=Rhodococcus spongiicola TaxID=2487352 RepID=A0A3S3A3Y5_9NOCA|nr:preprotein translocase subunit SecE [Rhodococcus spongiicola]RVW01534.1 preprotein translocase subunit SecE [Rhodococcus spongiicola]
MSEERGKRDGGTTGSWDSSPVDESAVSNQSANGNTSAEENPTSAVPAGRPSGKRTGRRAGAVEASKPAVAASSVRSPKARSVDASKSGAKKSGTVDKPHTENIFKRIRRFLREVIAELKKVIWPNRKQMITYTIVVLVFVTFMVTFISVLDVVFLRGASWLFG